MLGPVQESKGGRGSSRWVTAMKHKRNSGKKDLPGLWAQSQFGAPAKGHQLMCPSLTCTLSKKKYNLYKMLWSH